MKLKNFLLTTLLTTGSIFGASEAAAAEDECDGIVAGVAGRTSNYLILPVVRTFSKSNSPQQHPFFGLPDDVIMGGLGPFAFLDTRDPNSNLLRTTQGFLGLYDAFSLARTCQSLWNRLGYNLMILKGILHGQASIMSSWHLGVSVDNIDQARETLTNTTPASSLSKREANVLTGRYSSLTPEEKLQVVQYYFGINVRVARHLLHMLNLTPDTTAKTLIKSANVLSKRMRYPNDFNTILEWLDKAIQSTSAAPTDHLDASVLALEIHSKFSHPSFLELARNTLIKCVDEFGTLNVDNQQKVIIGLCKTGNVGEALTVARQYFEEYFITLLSEDAPMDTLTPVQDILARIIMSAQLENDSLQTNLHQLIIRTLTMIIHSNASNFDAQLGAAELLKGISLTDALSAYQTIKNKLVTAIANDSMNLTLGSARLSQCPQTDVNTGRQLTNAEIAALFISSRIEQLMHEITQSVQ